MIKLQGRSRIINGDEKLQVIREIRQAYVDGKLVQLEQTTHMVTCNVQPLNGRDLLLVPEGDRFKEQYWLFANPEQDLMTNDIVIRNGATYEVQSPEPWGSFTRARIMRKDQGYAPTT